MPRILVMSDLHLEFEDFQPPRSGFDLVVLAGDTHLGTLGVEWALRHFKVPVLYVSGNHEPYDGDLEETLRAQQEAACGTHVHVLENQMINLMGIRFIGATLWTDFALALSGSREDGLQQNMQTAERAMTDYACITCQGNGTPLTAGHIQQCHWRSRDFIRRALADRLSPTVVITHHAPHAGSLPARMPASLRSCYASRLEDALLAGADLWIHGHTHVFHDYTVFPESGEPTPGCRILCNPRGYPSQKTGWNPRLIVNI